MLTVAIDAGHGGDNEGCVSNGIIEKILTLTIAGDVASSLIGAPVACEMIRDCDETLTLAQRAALAAKFDADLVVSIHVNSSKHAHHNGALVFYWDTNAEGKAVAEAIAQAWPGECRAVPAAKNSGYPRVRNVLGKYDQTAVLVEVGFSSSKRDAINLLKIPHRMNLVSAIRRGVGEFLAVS